MSSKKFTDPVYFPGLPERIRKVRGDLTQKDFGKLFAVRNATISRYESGRVPDAETLKKIADYGGVTIEWLLRGEEVPEAPFPEEKQEKYITRPSAINFETLSQAIFLARQFIKRERQRLSDIGEAQLAAYLYEYLDSEKKDPAEVVIQRLADLIRKQEG
jgi:transcriptional regulator with XRE-family HTH domain